MEDFDHLICQVYVSLVHKGLNNRTDVIKKKIVAKRIIKVISCNILPLTMSVPLHPNFPLSKNPLLLAC